MFLLEAPGESLYLALASPWRLPTFLGLWPSPSSDITPTSASTVARPSLILAPWLLSFTYKDSVVTLDPLG